MSDQESRSPSAELLALPMALASFMKTLDDRYLVDVFREGDVTIIENFSPFIFAGADAVPRWVEGFRDHAVGLTGLEFRFGDAQDFSATQSEAFFTLPTTWTGQTEGVAFEENGGWAFVLCRQNEAWRLKGYAWAVTQYSMT
jgi:hypothetical protein